MTFEETYLNDNILDALYDMHFEDMTPIQEKCIPEILDGRDVLGVAKTGTGKTAAYLLPILSMLDDGDYPDDAINCVVMSPTRELAQQIDQAMEGFSYYLEDISSIAVYGGNDGNRFDQELKGLRHGAPVVIATPGRLLSHMKVGNLDLSRTSFFVLDEADRMLDMGFSEDILQINKLLPPTCQKIMFSATMPGKIRELAVSLLHDPVEVKIAVSRPAEKRELKAIDINCAPMHSDLTQAERDEVMYNFKAGHIDVLVATDIVARGIDIDDIRMVINYDVPHDAEDYVHRIGRTARADRDGVAITFINEKDVSRFMAIEHFLQKDVDKNPLPEGLGEGPEYIGRSGRKTTHSLKRRSSRSRWRRGKKSEAKQDAGQQDTDNTDTEEAPQAKNKKPRRRKRRKPSSTNNDTTTQS